MAMLKAKASLAPGVHLVSSSTVEAGELEHDCPRHPNLRKETRASLHPLFPGSWLVEIKAAGSAFTLRVCLFRSVAL